MSKIETKRWMNNEKNYITVDDYREKHRHSTRYHVEENWLINSVMSEDSTTLATLNSKTILLWPL